LGFPDVVRIAKKEQMAYDQGVNVIWVIIGMDEEAEEASLAGNVDTGIS